MQLNRLSIINYKNLAQVDLELSPKINGFIGNNGMGKTNVLDAIYYLSFCKSATNVLDASNISHDADFFLLQGRYHSDDSSPLSVSCGLKRGGRKKIKCDEKDCRKISEHVGRIPLVLLSPADSQLVSGGSEERRRFMDTVISQYNRPYLAHIIHYDRTLKQRNSLLKKEDDLDPGVLTVLEGMMAADAAVIYDARRQFIDDFLPIFKMLHRQLCPAEEDVDVKYITHGTRGDLAGLLESWRNRERIVGYTLHGPHKDDLDLLMNGYSIKREGSQGQTKTFFIAMKLAQFVFLKKRAHCSTPILLLDDIFDKLDAERVSRIVDYVNGDDFGQIFITDTNRDHLDSILSHSDKSYKLFHVSQGAVDEVSASVLNKDQ